MITKQRFRLKEYQNLPPQYYHATFKYIAHKVNSNKGKIPMILLTDIYLVDKNDRKIRLAKQNDFIDRQGRHIIADHLWVKMTKPWFNLPYSLIYGDEVLFKASIEEYRINRDDLLIKRDKIWQQALKENDKIYQRWSKYTDTHRRKNFQLSLNKMKAKQAANLKQVQNKQALIKLVDYSLNKISNIKIVKYNSAIKLEKRSSYNYEQYKKQGYKYSAWLAAVSIHFAEENLK